MDEELEAASSRYEFHKFMQDVFPFYVLTAMIAIIITILVPFLYYRGKRKVRN